MTLAAAIYRRLHWAGLPTSLLMSLLQRAPALRIAAAGEEIAASPPAAAILRSAVAAAASLGALDTLAGATTIVASGTNPLSVTVGNSVNAAFVVDGSQAPASSWSISGNLPPGLNFSGRTTPGNVNVETIDGHATLSGTVTTAGKYQMTMIAWEDPNATGASSSSFNYTVIVSANASAPSFTTQPLSQTVNVGQSVTFTAAASGSPTYQWQLNGSNISGATGATFTIASPKTTDAGNYSVVATNSSGSTTSATAALTVVDPNALPVFTTQPVGQTVLVGTNLTFTVAASGSPTYQWQFNGTKLSDGGNITGSATASLAIGNAQQSNAGNYSVVATNANGSTTSATATLSFNIASSAPALIVEPVSQTIASNTTATFTVLAKGVPAPAYQWYFNGATPISGATDATLLLTKATAANAGTYACVASNSAGSVTSLAARLSVAPTTNVGRLINLSVNTTAGPSPGQVLTVGFVTGGSGTSGSQTLLIRADGPALAALGVGGTLLADPTLSVLNGSTVVASNDNWGTPASNQALVTAADTATFAFPLNNPASLDAALVTALPVTPGYTVQVSGNTSTPGIVLAELYDDTSAGTYTLSTPRLINLSARNQVGANQSLTAGFSIGGTTSKTVLIRATGPALAAPPFNLSGTMPDPQLALHTSVNGQDTVLATNAGWGGDPQITAVDNSVFAFPLNNPSSADSVLLVTLPPGVYTAVGSSVSGTAGIALIEVYEVP